MPPNPERIQQLLNERLEAQRAAMQRRQRAVLARVQRPAATLHVRIYKGSKGAIGSRMLGAPCLLLTTTGAKTGLERTTPLGYGRDRDAYVLAASNGGSDRAPAWLHNITANNAVALQVGEEHIAGTARIVRPGEPQYDRLFGIVNASFGGRYYGYQELTERPIPVVVVEPNE